MFRILASILLLSLFILTQYGRQASYLQCKVENFTSKPNAPVCDCEKNNNNIANDDSKLPAQKTHVHASLDEYYVLNQFIYSSIHSCEIVKFSTDIVPGITSFNDNIFHPPQV